MRGAAFASTGRGDLAEEAYRYALALCFFPDDVSFSRKPARSDLWPSYKNVAHNMVLLLCGSGRAREAVPFAQAVAAGHGDPTDPEPWYELGTVAIDAGMDDVALDAYRKSIAANPRHSASYVNLVQTLEKRRAPGDAEEVTKYGKLAVKHGCIWEKHDQRPPHYFPGLDARPWHDAAEYRATRGCFERPSSRGTLSRSTAPETPSTRRGLGERCSPRERGTSRLDTLELY